MTGYGVPEHLQAVGALHLGVAIGHSVAPITWQAHPAAPTGQSVSNAYGIGSRSKLMTLALAAQELGARARTSTWAEAVEKLRSKQAVLKEQATVASHPLPDEPVRAPAAPSGKAPKVDGEPV